MTSLLATVLGLLAAFGLYLAAQSARRAAGPGEHLDAGAWLPGWTAIFAGSGVLAAILGPFDHLRLAAAYGFQANHLALALILSALAAALFQQRLRLAARIMARRGPGEILGAYYGSPSIRIVCLGILLLYAVPFCATLLGSAGEVLAQASGGAPGRLSGIAVIAFTLFMVSVIGGWRATVYAVAALSALAIALLLFNGLFIVLAFDSVALFAKGLTAAEGILTGRIPGVIQFSSGIGRDMPAGGIWTTTAIASFGLAAAGAALSPAFGFLGLTVDGRSAPAFSQVWMVAGLATGLLLLVTPIIAAEAGAAGGVTALTGTFAALDGFAAVCFTLLLLSGSLIAVAFFAASAASLFAIEFLARDLLPGLTPAGERLAARIALMGIYGLMAAAAGFLPALAAGLGALALPLSVQLLPAYLGLCWIPWMSRSAVLSGFILGGLVVLFTEPPGLALFGALFIDLPWGRWPLTIHSAAWGLAVNLAAALLVAIFTRKGAEREHRDALHAIFDRDHAQDFGGRAARGAKWSLVLLWAFFAVGPGAILGNTFFSRPMFLGEDIKLGAPSLWVWQIAFWIGGVMLVWWLAYQSRLSVHAADRLRSGELKAHAAAIGVPLQPRWLGYLVARLASRPSGAAGRRR